MKQSTDKVFYWTDFYQPTWRDIPEELTLPLLFTHRIEQHTFYCDMPHCLSLYVNIAISSYCLV